MQAMALPVHLSHQVSRSIHVLKEHDCHLATLSFALVFSVLFSCQGFVLCDVEDHGGLA